MAWKLGGETSAKDIIKYDGGSTRNSIEARLRVEKCSPSLTLTVLVTVNFKNYHDDQLRHPVFGEGYDMWKKHTSDDMYNFSLRTDEKNIRKENIGLSDGRECRYSGFAGKLSR